MAYINGRGHVGVAVGGDAVAGVAGLDRGWGRRAGDARALTEVFSYSETAYQPPSEKRDEKLGIHACVKNKDPLPFPFSPAALELS